MHTPSAAIAFELRQRHRWGLLVLAGYMLALAAIRVVALRSGRVEVEDPMAFAFGVVVPMTATVIYFLAVFTYGLSGDIAARESMYPARMFVLPVSTHTLVFWPMAFGSAAMAALWLGTRFLGIWPADVTVPVFWPILLGPSLLAWTQALTWMPYPLPGLRLVVTIAWLTMIDGVVLLALHFQPSESVMLALLAPHVPLAYLVARAAVARARRGDVADWRDLFAWLGRITHISPGRTPFASPAHAQEWIEWRQHGRSLPVLTGLLLPFELAMLFLFRNTPAIVIETLVMVLVTPPFLAMFVAPTAGRSFPATRPLSNGTLIGVKLATAVRSAVATWLLVLGTAFVALRLSGTWSIPADEFHDLAGILGPARAATLAAFVFLVLLVSTWKQLVQTLYVGLSGREWLIKASVFAPLTLLVVAVPVLHWVSRRKDLMAALFYALPWALAMLVALKTVLALMVLARLHRRGLVRDRTLLASAACWAAAVFALYGVLVWMMPEIVIRRDVLMVLAILTVPLVRVSAAPLALDWSRHR